MKKSENEKIDDSLSESEEETKNELGVKLVKQNYTPIKKVNANLKNMPRKQSSEDDEESSEEPKKRKPKKEEKKRSPYDCSGRQFQITLYDKNEEGIYEKISEYIKGRASLDYFISCRETCPDTGNTHWHIYCHFNCPVRLSKNKCFHSHLELCRGTPTENRNYIKKINEEFFHGVPAEWYHTDDNHEDIEEYGTLPRGMGGHLTGDDIKKMTVEEITMHDPRCHKAYLGAKNILETPSKIGWNNSRKTVKCFYIQGPSGSHKSDNAEYIGMKSELDPDGYNKIIFSNGFWDVTGTDSKIAIYDEFRDSHMKPSEFIRLIDYRVNKMNIKGGSITNKWELIIFTSIQSFDKLWKGMRDKEESRKQWERRIEVIDFYKATKSPHENEDMYEERLDVLKEYNKKIDDDFYNEKGYQNVSILQSD